MKSERTVTIPLDEYMELVAASKNQEKIYFESNAHQLLFGLFSADRFIYVGHDETIAAFTKSLNTELSNNMSLRREIAALKMDLAKCEDRAEHREPEPRKRRWRK